MSEKDAQNVHSHNGNRVHVSLIDADAMLIGGIILLIVLFAGDPDIADGIIALLKGIAK